MVKLLLKHKPDIGVIDRFGKKIYERAKTPEIAALVQSYEFAQQFSGKAPSTPSKSPGHKNFSSDRKNPLCSTIKKEFSKVADACGNERVTELIRAYMGKMQGRISWALTEKLESELAVQLSNTDAELRKYLGEDFMKSSTKAVASAMQLFNMNMEQALKRNGVESQPEMLLNDEEVGDIMRSGEVNCNYTEPNATLIDTLKLLSKTPVKPAPLPFSATARGSVTNPILKPKPETKRDRALSPQPTRPGEDESDLGVCLMSYMAGQFESKSAELEKSLCARVKADVSSALENMKAAFASANHSSFARLQQALEQKVNNIVSDKITRVAKSLQEKLKRENAARRSSDIATLSFQLQEQEKEKIRTRCEAAERFRSARLSRRSGTLSL